MISMGIMQVAVHQIADVVSMRHRLMPTPGTMHMIVGVAVALMPSRTPRRILIVHRQHVLVVVIPMGVMQMPIVEIVHMPIVANRRMPTVRTMLVLVILMLVATHILPPRSTPHSSE
jgi:hypothetical protein